MHEAIDVNSPLRINPEKIEPSLSQKTSLRAVPSRNYLQLVATQGQVQIHTSSVRGSFSIVLSEALRSAGLGSKVLISQFLRGGVNQGPNRAINLCGRLEWIRPAIETSVPEKLIDENLPIKKRYEEKAIQEIWEVCKTRLKEKNLDKIVLDEIGLAINLGFIKENELISIIKNRPASTDIILTGTSIPTKAIEMADQITELRCT